MVESSPPGSPDRALAAAEARRVTALISADLAGLDQLCDDDVQWVHVSGRIDDKKTMLDMLGSGRIRFTDITSEAPRVRDYGTFAVSTGPSDVSFVANGDQRTNRNVVTLVWRHTDAGWRLVLWQSTPRPQV